MFVQKTKVTSLQYILEKAKGWLSSNLFKSSALVVLLLGAAKGISLVKEMMVADRIGVSAALDAFIMAMTIMSGVSLIFRSSFSQAMLPEFVKVDKKTPHLVSEYFSSMMWIGATGFALILCFLLATRHLYLPFFVGSFDQTTSDLTGTYLFYLVPYLFLDYFAAMYLKALNAKKKHTLLSLEPIFVSGITILLFLLLAPENQVINLLIGLNIGTTLLLIASYWQARKLGIRLQFRIRYNEQIKRTLKEFFPFAFAMFLITLKLLIDNGMTANLGVGNVSSLTYGNKVYSMIAVIPCTAISIILYPYFSDLIAQQKFPELKKVVKKIVLGIGILSVLLAAFIIFQSEWIVYLLFERGAFTNENTKEVAFIFSMYIVGLPFNILGILGIRLISALQMNKVLIVSGFIDLLVNIGFNILLVQYLQTAGIALATSIAFLAILIFYGFVIFRRLKTTKAAI